MGKPWFHVKRYGLGAGLPCSWEGWVTLGAFVTLAMITVLLSQDYPSVTAPAILLLTAIFALIAWRKSDGPWKWRNGGD